jgi:hypothetical protein
MRRQELTRYLDTVARNQAVSGIIAQTDCKWKDAPKIQARDEPE